MIGLYMTLIYFSAWTLTSLIIILIFCSYDLESRYQLKPSKLKNFFYLGLSALLLSNLVLVISKRIPDSDNFIMDMFGGFLLIVNPLILPFITLSFMGFFIWVQHNARKGIVAFVLVSCNGLVQYGINHFLMKYDPLLSDLQVDGFHTPLGLQVAFVLWGFSAVALFVRSIIPVNETVK